MRIRAKFTKQGNVKFVGHLDTVRLFQRALKVAKMPLAYSEGFNPHPKTYFALPLSVGVSSVGEYLEFITTTDINIEEAKEQINNVLPEGISLTEVFEVTKEAKRLMSIVGMADYEVLIQKDEITKEFEELYNEMIASESITIEKKNKKGRIKEVDIKPMIVESKLEVEETHYKMWLKVFAGSEKNLKPDAVLQAMLKEDFANVSYELERKELYAKVDQAFVSIAACDKA